MTFLWVALAGVLGLFAGAAIRNLAIARATGTFHPRPARGWLPLAGVGPARAGTPEQLLAGLMFELAVAAYYALLVARHGDDPGWVVSVILFSVPLLILLLVDAWTRLIHTNIIAGGVLLGLVGATFEGFPQLGQAAAGGLVALAIGGILFAVAGFISQRVRVVPFGLGDVYLMAMIGTMVRFDRIFFALFAGILLAALASVILLLGRGLGARRPLSFGPYLCAGALATLLL